MLAKILTSIKSGVGIADLDECEIRIIVQDLCDLKPDPVLAFQSKNSKKPVLFLNVLNTSKIRLQISIIT